MKCKLRNVLVSLATVVGACALLAGAASADPPPRRSRLYLLARLTLIFCHGIVARSCLS